MSPAWHLCPASPCTQAQSQGCQDCCLSAPQTQKCKPSAINPAKSCFVWPQPLPGSVGTEMVKAPWDGRAPQSLCSITWQDKRRGARGRAGQAVPQCRAAAHTALLLLFAAPACHGSVCPCVPMGTSPFFSEHIHFYLSSLLAIHQHSLAALSWGRSS